MEWGVVARGDGGVGVGVCFGVGVGDGGWVVVDGVLKV